MVNFKKILDISLSLKIYLDEIDEITVEILNRPYRSNRTYILNIYEDNIQYKYKFNDESPMIYNRISKMVKNNNLNNDEIELLENKYGVKIDKTNKMYRNVLNKDYNNTILMVKKYYSEIYITVEIIKGNGEIGGSNMYHIKNRRVRKVKKEQMENVYDQITKVNSFLVKKKNSIKNNKTDDNLTENNIIDEKIDENVTYIPSVVKITYDKQLKIAIYILFTLFLLFCFLFCMWIHKYKHFC